MHVVILGTEKVDGVNCWKVDFLIPDKKPAGGITARHRVCIDEQDGWPRKAFSFRDYRNLTIDQFDKARLLTVAPEGYPVEIFPPAEMRSTKGTKSSYTAMISTIKETGVRTVILRAGNENELEIRQTWKEGENWWQNYERYRRGKLDLRARLVPKVVAKAPDVKPAPKEVVKTPTETKAPTTTYIDQTMNPLRADPRLQGTITLNLGDPTVQDILSRFSKATKLTFSTEEDADTSTPVFAAINWVNVPVWSAMDQLARSAKIKGRWEKTGDGYRLDGVPHMLNPPPPRSYGWAWATGGVLLTLAATGGALVTYRRRGTKPAATPSKEVAQAKSPTSNKKPT